MYSNGLKIKVIVGVLPADRLIFRNSVFLAIDLDKKFPELLPVPDISGIKGDNFLIVPDRPVKLALGNRLLRTFQQLVLF
jgi:hypothetical protein